MGVEVSVEGLTKSFGSQNIWRDVTLTLPEGEVSALLGPSGTGKSVFLKTLIGLLHPEQGSVIIDGTDILQCTAKELYENPASRFVAAWVSSGCSMPRSPAYPQHPHAKGTVACSAHAPATRRR